MIPSFDGSKPFDGMGIPLYPSLSRPRVVYLLLQPYLVETVLHNVKSGKAGLHSLQGAENGVEGEKLVIADAVIYAEIWFQQQRRIKRRNLLAIIGVEGDKRVKSRKQEIFSL